MPTIDEIKAWMKKQGMSRLEFAEKVGVRITSVNNWLAGYTKIPAGRLAIIENVMAPRTATMPAAIINLADVKTIVVKLSADELEACEKVAAAAGKDLETWARDVVLGVTAAALAENERKKGG